jgi:hypothetical protein
MSKDEMRRKGRAEHVFIAPTVACRCRLLFYGAAWMISLFCLINEGKNDILQLLG